MFYKLPKIPMLCALFIFSNTKPMENDSCKSRVVRYKDAETKRFSEFAYHDKDPLVTMITCCLNKKTGVKFCHETEVVEYGFGDSWPIDNLKYFELRDKYKAQKEIEF